MSIKNTARSRTRYTGEPYSVALNYLREYGLDHGLVPEAAELTQQTFEAVVLMALVATIGAHHPARTGGVYGLAAVSPTPESVKLYPSRVGGDSLATALLPRADEHGWSGVPGLRAQRARNGVTVLAWPDGSRILVMDVVFARLADAHRASAGPVGSTERDLMRDRQRSVSATAGPASTTLRRIGLFLDSDRVDFAAELPTEQILAGPSDPSPRPVPAASFRKRRTVVLAFASRRGGVGATTIAALAAGALASAGRRVAIVEAGHDTWLLDAFGGLRWTGTSPPQAVLKAGTDIPTGGRLSVLNLSSQPSIAAVSAAIKGLRGHADAIILDVGSTTTSAVLPTNLVNQIVVPVDAHHLPFTQVVQPEPTERDQLRSWLDDQFDRWHDCRSDRYARAGRATADLRDQFAMDLARFRDHIDTRARHSWPHQWTDHSATVWMRSVTHGQFSALDDPDPDQAEVSGWEEMADWLDVGFDDWLACPYHRYDPTGGAASADARRVLHAADVATFLEVIDEDAARMWPTAWTATNRLSWAHAMDGEFTAEYADAATAIGGDPENLAADPPAPDDRPEPTVRDIPAVAVAAELRRRLEEQLSELGDLLDDGRGATVRVVLNRWSRWATVNPHDAAGRLTQLREHLARDGVDLLLPPLPDSKHLARALAAVPDGGVAALVQSEVAPAAAVRALAAGLCPDLVPTIWRTAAAAAVA